MTFQADGETFFSGIATFAMFEGVADEANYRPLPDDWILALADVVSSTEAIRNGRYKDVNMAGASVISAVLNAVDKADYPYIFGGDGALLALPGSKRRETEAALVSIKGWVKTVLDLELRIALVPVSAIRAAGQDVKVARYAPNEFVRYAMFSGGGTSFAEAQMKLGQFVVDESLSEADPDLTGLSCRWSPIEARNGEVVSIIVVPGEKNDPFAFQEMVSTIVSISSEQDRGGHPIPADGPKLAFSKKGVRREIQATAIRGGRLMKRLSIMTQIFLTSALYKLNMPFGKFDAHRYKRDVSANSDFRKFDDGLKMTIDIDKDRLQRIEAVLKKAEGEGLARYGLHRQTSALMTCFVPTPLSRDHVHFIDGADGGYAVAATQIKDKLQIKDNLAC
jgi:hypothetical protein